MYQSINANTHEQMMMMMVDYRIKAYMLITFTYKYYINSTKLLIMIHELNLRYEGDDIVYIFLMLWFHFAWKKGISVEGSYHLCCYANMNVRKEMIH